MRSSPTDAVFAASLRCTNRYNPLIQFMQLKKNRHSGEAPAGRVTPEVTNCNLQIFKPPQGGGKVFFGILHTAIQQNNNIICMGTGILANTGSYTNLRLKSV